MAAEKGHDEIVKVLLAAKADKDAQDKVRHMKGTSFPLDLWVGSLLVGRHGNVVVYQQGKTALMWVTEKGQATTANLLLGAGADVHFGDKVRNRHSILLMSKFNCTLDCDTADKENGA
jgi:ankyrin repeat protein